MEIVSFFMNIVVSHKEYWEMSRNIRFYNPCFKFVCGKRVDEYMIMIGLFMIAVIL